MARLRPLVWEKSSNPEKNLVVEITLDFSSLTENTPGVCRRVRALSLLIVFGV